MPEEPVELLKKAINKLSGEVSDLQIRYFNKGKDRYDFWGTFKKDDGDYEFIISLDKKGNVKRSKILKTSASIFDKKNR